jgi:hypothetical protein
MHEGATLFRHLPRDASEGGTLSRHSRRPATSMTGSITEPAHSPASTQRNQRIKRSQPSQRIKPIQRNQRSQRSDTTPRRFSVILPPLSTKTLATRPFLTPPSHFPLLSCKSCSSCPKALTVLFPYPCYPCHPWFHSSLHFVFRISTFTTLTPSSPV